MLCLYLLTVLSFYRLSYYFVYFGLSYDLDTDYLIYLGLPLCLIDILSMISLSRLLNSSFNISFSDFSFCLIYSLIGDYYFIDDLEMIGLTFFSTYLGSFDLLAY
jgi:hypothetical protein